MAKTPTPSRSTPPSARPKGILGWLAEGQRTLQAATEVVEGLQDVRESFLGEPPEETPPIPEGSSTLVRLAMVLDEAAARTRPGIQRARKGAEVLKDLPGKLNRK